jgi:hypothetical protein
LGGCVFDYFRIVHLAHPRIHASLSNSACLLGFSNPLLVGPDKDSQREEENPMAVSYRQVMPYVGQRVVAHGIDGRRHYGILQSVTPTGIHIRPMRWGTQVSAESTEIQADLADKPQAVEGETVFLPLLVLPFLALAALWPWYAYPYRGYGYGYYW